MGEFSAPSACRMTPTLVRQIERQGESIEHWARAHEHTVVAMTEDTDVSGSIAPQDRDELGPWLTDRASSRSGTSSALPSSTALTRSLLHFDDLRIWADEHGKTIASVAESLDLSTSTGRMFANLLAMFAQFERERMCERRADASRKLYSRGGYNGGSSLPWGYRTIRQNGRLELEPDPTRWPRSREIVDEVLAGKAVTGVARASAASTRRRCYGGCESRGPQGLRDLQRRDRAGRRRAASAAGADHRRPHVGPAAGEATARTARALACPHNADAVAPCHLLRRVQGSDVPHRGHGTPRGDSTATTGMSASAGRLQKKVVPSLYTGGQDAVSYFAASLGTRSARTDGTHASPTSLTSLRRSAQVSRDPGKWKNT